VRALQKGNPIVVDRRRSPLAEGNRDLAMNSQNRCRRSNGSLRAWFATKAEAIALAGNPMNTAYHGDIPVLYLKRGCDPRRGCIRN
jgi:hypothetical protein